MIILHYCQFKKKFKHSKPNVKDINVSGSDVEETTKECLECTDWNITFDSSESINENVDVISDYINFCVYSTIPMKTVTAYINNKPWISMYIKWKIHQKNTMKMSNYRCALTQCLKELDTEIHTIKNSNKFKLEGYFKGNHTRAG